MHSQSEQAPDRRIFHNGRIHTMDDALPSASVLGVDAGRLVYVGASLREAQALLAGAETVDLEGRVVVPGLTDSHQHFIMQGQALAELDVRHRPKNEILRLVAERAAGLKPGEWVVGRGWNHELWPERQWPRKEELDAAAPDNPVALTRLDGHSMWVNSLALRAGGLDRNSPELPGGEILRTDGGDLWGILVDTPIFKVRSAIPAPGPEQKRDACLRAQAEMFGYGITSVGDAWQTPEDHGLLRELYEAGALRIRIYGMLASRGREDEALAGVSRCPVAGLYGGRLSLRAFKIVLDGSLGSRSAWLADDYADRPGHRGSSRYSDEQLLAVLSSALGRGFQACIHAIGSAAVLQAVRVLERARRETPGPWLRHRIEHFQIAAPETVARALALGVIPSMQTLHAYADRAMAETRLRPADLARSYPWREVLDGGGIIANGSDSPMDGVNPFHGMHAAITRTPFACLRAERERVGLTRKEALQSYTLWPAFAELNGGGKGSLTLGKAADFAVLDRDILACPADAVRDTRVLMTVLAGETVYDGRVRAAAG